MVKPPRKHSRPEDIEIRWEDGYKPAPDELAAMEELRRQVFKHAGDVGIQYDVVAATPNDFSTFSARGNKPLAASLKKGLGLTDTTHEKTVFIANSHTMLGCIADGVDLEGIIKHEAGHAHKHAHMSCTKLNATIQIMDGLGRLANRLDLEPGKMEEGIREQFGSMEKFHQATSHFEARVMPVIEALERQPELLSASPEKLAILMENDDPSYRRLEQELEKLPGYKELSQFGRRIDKSLPTESWADRVATARQFAANASHSSVEPNETSHPELRRLGNQGRRHALLGFAAAISKAEEYAVDAFAWKNSSNPKSLPRLLEWCSAKDAATYHTPVELVLKSEAGTTHPSSEKRIKRMEYLQTHGTAPDESYLNPPAALPVKFSILNELQSAIHQSSHSAAAKEASTAVSGILPANKPKRSR